MRQDFWLHLMYRSNKSHGKNQFPRLIKWSIQVISSSYFLKTDTRNWTETKLVTQMVAYQRWNGNSLLLIQFRSGANDWGGKSYQTHNEFVEPFFDSHVCVGKNPTISVSNKKQWKTFSTADLLSALFSLANTKCHKARTCFQPVCSHIYSSHNSEAPFPSVRKCLHICEAKSY